MADITDKQNTSLFSEEELLRYVKGDIDNATAHRIERAMLKDPALNDIIEGLSHYHTVKHIHEDVHFIHKKIKAQTGRKPVKPKRQFAHIQWGIVIVFFLIIITLIAYSLISKMIQ